MDELRCRVGTVRYNRNEAVLQSQKSACATLVRSKECTYTRRGRTAEPTAMDDRDELQERRADQGRSHVLQPKSIPSAEVGTWPRTGGTGACGFETP